LQRWHGERRTVIAVLHDFEIVRRHFPDVVYLARRLVGWGPVGEVLTPENQLAARRMAESWDEQAGFCHVDHTDHHDRSEEHTSELQSLMRISYAVFGLK